MSRLISLSRLSGGHVLWQERVHRPERLGNVRPDLDVYRLGKGATALNSDTTYYIDDVSGPWAGLSGGHTVPTGYVLKFEDNFDEIDKAQTLSIGRWSGSDRWGNNELQNYIRTRQTTRSLSTLV